MKWLAAILLVAAPLRFLQLDERPMHADEAILADRLGTLLETGEFHYDPDDFHGPVLAYASWPVARAGGASTYVELGERLIRAVPAIFGAALVVFAWMIGRTAGSLAGAFAGLFTAVSPGLVYFSRYYIPEVLLVCFSAGLLFSLMCYAAAPVTRWAVLAGLFTGLMFATKETAVLAFLAAGAGFTVLRPRVERSHVLIAAAAGSAVALAAFGPAALWEALRSVASYAARAADPPLHGHPWFYYLGILFGSADGLFLIAAFAAVPALFARQRVALFLFTYSVVLTLLYSLLRYKTPWCAMGFLHGWILLAAVGTADLVHRWRSLGLGVAAVCAALLIFAWRGSFALASDPANPYVYAHTLPDVYRLRDRVAGLARNHPEGAVMRVQVFTTENLWPIPWYLREYPNVRWWRAVPPEAPRAPVILMSPTMEDAVARHLYELPPPGERELYVNLFDEPLWLRPGVEVRGYAVMSLASR